MPPVAFESDMLDFFVFCWFLISKWLALILAGSAHKDTRDHNKDKTDKPIEKRKKEISTQRNPSEQLNEPAKEEDNSYFSPCVFAWVCADIGSLESVWLNVILIGIWMYKNPLDLNWLRAMHDYFIDFLWNYSLLMMIAPMMVMTMILDWNSCICEYGH